MERSHYLSILSASILLLVGVSFCSFADPYTGAYLEVTYDDQGLPITTIQDNNPSGQIYSGSNVIEVNAYNNAPVLTDNTFNGSTDIKPAFTDITSNSNTYNGTTDVTYSSAVGGNLQSNSDTFQTTSVSASDADVSFNDPTFNGSVTLSANNISVGSIDQMDDLLDIQTSISNTLTNLRNIVQQTIVSQFDDLRVYVLAFLNYFRFYNITDDSSESTFDLTVGNITHTFSWIEYTYRPFSFNSTTQAVVRDTTGTQYWVSFSALLDLKFEELITLIHSYVIEFREWYYPLDSESPYFWRYYNTDTGQSEAVGLAGLMYNISWYLGEIYNNLVDSGTALTQDAEDLAESITDLNTAEDTVFNNINTSFQAVGELMVFPTVTACADVVGWIEYMWVSLGIFQAPTLLGYMAVILMMLVGYAKFKGVFR